MNIAVRYQSRGGNTRAVAEIIANELGVQAEEISIPIKEKVDILFIGGGVYRWKADKKLVDFLKDLSPKQVRKVAAFSTSGAMKTTTNKICEVAKANGIDVADDNLCLKMMMQGHAALGMKGGKLKPNQVSKVKEFIGNVLKTIE